MLQSHALGTLSMSRSSGMKNGALWCSLIFSSMSSTLRVTYYGTVMTLISVQIMLRNIWLLVGVLTATFFLVPSPWGSILWRFHIRGGMPSHRQLGTSRSPSCFETLSQRQLLLFMAWAVHGLTCYRELLVKIIIEVPLLNKNLDRYG